MIRCFAFVWCLSITILFTSHRMKQLKHEAVFFANCNALDAHQMSRPSSSRCSTCRWSVRRRSRFVCTAVTRRRSTESLIARRCRLHLRRELGHQDARQSVAEQAEPHLPWSPAADNIRIDDRAASFTHRFLHIQTWILTSIRELFAGVDSPDLNTASMPNFTIDPSLNKKKTKRRTSDHDWKRTNFGLGARRDWEELELIAKVDFPTVC